MNRYYFRSRILILPISETRNVNCDPSNDQVLAKGDKSFSHFKKEILPSRSSLLGADILRAVQRRGNEMLTMSEGKRLRLRIRLTFQLPSPCSETLRRQEHKATWRQIFC